MEKKALTFVMAERLKTLRKEAGYSHQKLSEELRKRYEIKISKDALITYEAPEFHTNAGANDGMSVRYLRCLADFFSVSADYLLGLSDVKTPDMDERAACEYTGLSPAALYCLTSVFTKPYCDGEYIMGHKDTDPCTPRTFIEAQLRGSLFNTALIFSDAINAYLSASAPDRTAREYGKVSGGADVVISAREYALLKKEAAKACFTEGMDVLWNELCTAYNIPNNEAYDYATMQARLRANIDAMKEARNGEAGS